MNIEEQEKLSKYKNVNVCYNIFAGNIYDLSCSRVSLKKVV